MSVYRIDLLGTMQMLSGQMGVCRRGDRSEEWVCNARLCAVGELGANEVQDEDRSR